MIDIRKKQFNPPKFEAFVEDDGDSFQVALFQEGVQVGNAMFPDDGDGSAFQAAQALADTWKSGGGWGGVPPHIDLLH